MKKTMPNYAQQDITFIKGEGSFLYDTDNKQYLDFGCGISVNNLGHNHPHLLNCLDRQKSLLWHTSNIYPNKIVEELAQRISNAAFNGKIFFCNSGAEANEGAIKLALIYNNKILKGMKKKIVTMKNSFHGRTVATLAATGQEKVQTGFEPILDWFTYVELNDENALKKEFAKGDVLAVMLELFQGESGVLPAKESYVRLVRELCTQNNALMIVDEVQTGFGRTGKFLAYQHTDIEPDIITMAKAIANGLPMGAILAKNEIADLFTPGTHGSTFGGNLLAASVSHGVLDVILEDGFLNSVTEKGSYASSILEKKLAKYGVSIRGKGLMIGIDLKENLSNTEIIKECANRGLIVIAGGKHAIRFYPPLNATIQNIEKGADILEEAILSVLDKGGNHEPHQ